MEVAVSGYRRGALAKLLGIGVETLRFYEQRGLLDPPQRNRANHRVYPDSAVSRLKFIQRCQDAGFSLREIKDLLTLMSGSETTCLDVCDFVEGKVERINHQIASLTEIRDTLQSLSLECRSRGDKPLETCLILDHLEAGE